MKGGYKSLIKRRMAVGLIVVLVCGMLPVPGKTVQAASAISMTAFYNDGAYGIGYLEAKAGKQVTISSKEEMEMFFACLKEEERTSGISFLQTEDITFGEYEFVYDEESERIGIYADNALAAAVSEEGEFYKTYTGSTQSSVEKCGLTESYLYRSIDEPDIFYGTYDGGGYSISGLIFQSETSYTSGIFGQIKQGAVVSNLTVKNCLLAKAYGGIMGMNEGTVDNCVADSLTGICDAIGGIAECNSGQISNCRTIHSELIVAGSGDNRLGGITAGNYNGIIESCQTKDTILRSDEEIDAMVGGIAGCQRFETLAQSGIFDCISAAELVGGKYTGGVAGYVYSTGITPQITNCINMGEIYTAKNTISLGGIVGSAADGSSLSVENCGNYGKIVYDENAVTSSANIGGIAGTADGTLTVTDCVNHGEICASDESNPDTAAMFCIGGLVGYSTGELQIVNSANYGLVAEVHSGITKISGGIAGYLGNVSETAVYNCYNIGQVSGTYAGGLIGCGMAADSGTLLTVAENSYNYGEVYGETAGALFGMTSALICSHGYWRDGAAQNMIAGEKSDNITDDVWENCHSVSAEEMASLDTVLNDWVGEQNGDSVYSEWGQEGNGYPEFVYSTQEEMYLAGETEESQSGGTSAEATEESQSGGTSAGTTEESQSGGTSAGTTEESQSGGTSAGTTEESQSGGTSAGTTEEPQSSGAPSAGATEEPQSSASSAEETVSSKLTVKKLRASVNANCSVTLSWSKNANAKKYQLYRSTGKKYTRIATIKGKTKYTDKEAPKGKKVYYRLRAVGSNTSLSGNYSKVVKAKVLWLRTPTIQVSKGETSLGKASVAVRLKKYDGTYAEIYVSQDGKKYVKIPLKSGTIKSFKKVYRLTYSYKKFQKQTLYFKVRTYKMHGTEKRKSSFSKVKRIVL